MQNGPNVSTEVLPVVLVQIRRAWRLPYYRPREYLHRDYVICVINSRRGYGIGLELDKSDQMCLFGLKL
jgi:hypothetical protein